MTTNMPIEKAAATLAVPVSYLAKHLRARNLTIVREGVVYVDLFAASDLVGCPRDVIVDVIAGRDWLLTGEDAYTIYDIAPRKAVFVVGNIHVYTASTFINKIKRKHGGK